MPELVLVFDSWFSYLGNMKRIEVCLSPALFEYQKNIEDIVVVVDILRATSSICTAFESGVAKLIPVESRAIAKEYKEKGYTVAAERDGIRLDFADLGNSPDNFLPEIVKGKEVVYSTTNGTKTIMMSADCYKVVIGSFLNLTAMCNWLKTQDRDVMVLCAGWKNRFNIEDTVFAGAVVENLIDSGDFATICDSAKASLDMWKNHKHDLYGLMQQTAQKGRLSKNNLDSCIQYCVTVDITTVIPVLENDHLIAVDNTL